MIVVDASVWVSSLLQQDSNHQMSVHWFSQYTITDGILIAPYILLSEVAGPVARRTGDAVLARQTVNRLLQLSKLRLVPVDRKLGVIAAEIAGDMNLRGADAVYVAVAQRLSVPLVTWDKEQLQRAAQRIAVYSP